jgi:hypothetical protein
LALPNQISRLILGPDGSQRPQKRTAEKQCLPFHVNRRLPYDFHPATVVDHSEKFFSGAISCGLNDNNVATRNPG